MKTNFSLFITFLLCCALFQQAAAQSASNRGKDFWLAYPAHASGLDSKMSLYITSTVSTHGTVTIPGLNYTAQFSVNANQVTEVNIPGSAYVSSSETVENKGIHITADLPVVVFSHIYAYDVSGSTLVLPITSLGMEYYVISHENSNASPSSYTSLSEFIVVASEDHTIVEITPTALTSGGARAGEPFQVSLMKGQVYQVQAEKDLTGSKVISVGSEGQTCKRIAVFSGSTFTRMGCSEASSGDNLYQQLYPVNSWGKEFATAPMMTRWGGDKYRVMASANGTSVTVNGGAPFILNQGQYRDFITNKPNFISADKPVMVAQYPLSQNCDGVTGDPEMIVLSPVDQTLTDITVYSSPNFMIATHYINIVMATKDVGSFKLDWKPVTFKPIPGNPAYSFAQVKVDEGTHRLVAEAGFSAIAYGFGVYESYGYAAGASVKNKEQHIVLESESSCRGELTKFKGYASYEPVSWRWDFGDGRTSTEQNPLHEYGYVGTYTVTLTTVRGDGGGCDSKDVSTAVVTVYPNPTVAFNIEADCENSSIQFYNNVSFEGGNSHVAKVEWDFGDGGTSTELDPLHTFEKPGNYLVRFRVTTSAGCISKYAREIQVAPMPVAAFDAASVCHTAVTAFRDRSVSDVPITGWRWDFGDGSPLSEVQHPQHTYASPGTFDVKLTIFFDGECQTSVTSQVVVHPRPQVKMQLPDVCIRDEAQFVNQSSITAGTLSYLWEFGDGSTSTEVNPRHRYTAEGNYRVRLTAISEQGCSETLETDYLVSGAYPQASFSATEFCQREGVQFKDESTIPFGRIIRWEWDFGDGQTSDEQHPKHNYQRTGTYKVSLKVYSGIICQGTVSKTVTILANPVAAFEIANVCLGEQAHFTSRSTVAGGSIVAYRWEFGDGRTSDQQHPSHRYTTAGTYSVSLVVTTDQGCQNNYSQQITVHPTPQAAFTPEIGCLADAVTFRDMSTVAGGAITGWRWDFGDGGTSTTQHPTHQYARDGSYQVKLEVTTDKGCRTILERTVSIRPLPVAEAGEQNILVCGTTSTRLTANNPAPATGTWTILSGTGGAISDAQHPAATFTGRMGERYKLRWTVSNSPCEAASDEVEITFSSYPQVNAGPDLEIIEGESVTLQGSGTGTLKWSPAISLDNASIARPSATPEVTTTYTMEATSTEGCMSTDQVTVRVLQRLKIPNGISPNGDGINDVWIIQGAEDYPDMSVDIYNRWGDKVYFSRGYSKTWDGTRNGVPLPDGAYYYIIDTGKGRKPFTGSITVLR